MELIKKYEIVREIRGCDCSRRCDCGLTPHNFFGVKFRRENGKIGEREFKNEALRSDFINEKLNGVFSTDGQRMSWSNIYQEYYVPNDLKV